MGKRIDQKKDIWMTNKHMKVFLSAVIIKEMHQNHKEMPSCIHWDGYYQKEGRKGKNEIARVWWEYGKSESVALLVRMDGTIKQYGGPSKLKT